MANARESAAPNIYPLGHPRNPVTAASSGPTARRVPEDHSVKLARVAAERAAAREAAAVAAAQDMPDAPAPAEAPTDTPEV